MEQRIANKGEIADESALKSTQDVSSISHLALKYTNFFE